MLKGGTNSFGVVLMQELEVLAILKGVANIFPHLKGRAQKLLPCPEGGGTQKVLDPQFFHFVAPSPPRN